MALTATHRPAAALPGRGRPARGSAVAIATIVAVVLVAFLGVAMAVGILRDRGVVSTAPLADPAAADLGLGQAVRTSFGSLTAAEALINNGLTTEDLGGMSHGVSNLVTTGTSEVNVVVTLRNTGKREVGVDATQFVLLTGANGVATGKPIKATGTTLQAGGLAPHASLDARVTFVAPTNGAQLWLRFTDPHGARPIQIALGRTDAVTAPASPEHQH